MTGGPRRTVQMRTCTAEEAETWLQRHLRTQHKTVRGAFLALDEDRDGCITAPELNAYLRIHGIRMPRSEREEFVAKCNGDGRLGYDDFQRRFGPTLQFPADDSFRCEHRQRERTRRQRRRQRAEQRARRTQRQHPLASAAEAEAALLSQLYRRHKTVRSAFRTLDADGNQRIERAELLAMLRRCNLLGPALEPPRCAKALDGLLRRLGADSDGSVCFAAFRRVVGRYMAPSVAPSAALPSAAAPQGGRTREPRRCPQPLQTKVGGTARPGDVLLPPARAEGRVPAPSPQGTGARSGSSAADTADSGRDSRGMAVTRGTTCALPPLVSPERGRPVAAGAWAESTDEANQAAAAQARMGHRRRVGIVGQRGV